MTDRSSYIGIGLYTYIEAARIIGQSPSNFRRWAHGYYYRYGGERQFSQPLFSHEYPELASEGFVTFLELIHLYLVSSFLSHGVSMTTIRQVAQKTAERFATTHPFAIRGFRTDGQIILAELESSARKDRHNEPLYEDLLRGQMVIAQIVEPFLHNIDYRNDLAHMYWPIGREKGIVLDPKRSFGQPILSQYAIPTYPIYRTYLAGDPPDVIARWYRIDEAYVLSAIEYEKQIAA